MFKNIKRPIIIAHRGASAVAPENTRVAFALAKKMGVPAIEFDIHLTADGELVVIHDFEINRTARMRNGKKIDKGLEVENLTLAQLRKYDFGIWRGKKFAGEKIPTLKETLDLIGQKIIINIEIKVASKRPYKEVTMALVDFLYEYFKTKPIDNIFVSSFNPMAISLFKREMKKYKIKIPTGLFYGTNKEVPWYLKYGQGRFVCRPDIRQVYYKDLLDKEDLSGFGAWTVDNPKIAKRLLNRGIWAITTNVPEKILPLIKK